MQPHNSVAITPLFVSPVPTPWVGLADDWEAQRQPCVDVLCAYIRSPWPSQSAKDLDLDRANHAVRRTILAIIGDHLRSDCVPNWSSLYFDFSSSSFKGLSFKRALFDATPNFAGSKLSGECRFDDCIFTPGGSFDGCRIEGHLEFMKLHVAGCGRRLRGLRRAPLLRDAGPICGRMCGAAGRRCGFLDQQ